MRVKQDLKLKPSFVNLTSHIILYARDERNKINGHLNRGEKYGQAIHVGIGGLDSLEEALGIVLLPLLLPPPQWLLYV